MQPDQAVSQRAPALGCKAEDWALNDCPPRMTRSEAKLMANAIAQRFQAYGTDVKRSILQLTTTATLFVALLVIMATLMHNNYGLTLFLAVPAAGLLIRLFVIQHDCGHGSYFRSRTANDVLGRVLAMWTLTPYGHWRHGHAMHHASNGNLDRRGHGDVEILTVAEYESVTPLKRLGYRLYRNPFIMVLLGAPINFIVLQRLPTGRARRDPNARRSIMSLNLVMLGAFGVPMAIFGILPVLAIYLPVLIIASWIGNWIFYVQHQFEDTYWKQGADWDFQTAALCGSSYFKLPIILQWFSGNIGLHHIHHLCSRVPNYRLQACLEIAPELNLVAKQITLRDSLKCWRLALWDEQRCRMVGFRDLQRPTA
jgi:omega-6 fatty acid desaturase (delta-12 desaturase)